ncbi:MAG: hypothetical protein U0X76_02985 [Bacteroidia bacterium]
MTAAPYDLTHTGGNFMVDGFGTAFSSKLVMDENPTKTEADNRYDHASLHEHQSLH